MRLFCNACATLLPHTKVKHGSATAAAEGIPRHGAIRFAPRVMCAVQPQAPLPSWALLVGDTPAVYVLKDAGWQHILLGTAGNDELVVGWGRVARDYWSRRGASNFHCWRRWLPTYPRALGSAGLIGQQRTPQTLQALLVIAGRADF